MNVYNTKSNCLIDDMKLPVHYSHQEELNHIITSIYKKSKEVFCKDIYQMFLMKQNDMIFESKFDSYSIYPKTRKHKRKQYNNVFLKFYLSNEENFEIIDLLLQNLNQLFKGFLIAYDEQQNIINNNHDYNNKNLCNSNFKSNTSKWDKKDEEDFSVSNGSNGNRHFIKVYYSGNVRDTKILLKLIKANLLKRISKDCLFEIYFYNNYNNCMNKLQDKIKTKKLTFYTNLSKLSNLSR